MSLESAQCVPVARRDGAHGVGVEDEPNGHMSVKV